MKKLFAALAVLACLVFAFSACTEVSSLILPSAEGSPEPSATAKPTPTAAASPSGTPYVRPTPTPAQTPATDIPDVVFGEHETAIQSGYIFENENDIYYGNEANSIVRIRKADLEMSVIEPGSSELTSYNGMLYYIGESGTYIGDLVSTIIRYDPQTGKKENIISLSYGIYDITAYNGKIYYLYWADPDNNDFHLYAVNLDGTNNQLIKRNVCSFCIYNDMIYYMQDVDSYEPTKLCRCNLDGSDKETVVDDIYPDDLAICDDKLYCSDKMLNLITGETTSIFGFGNVTVLGQYLLYTGPYCKGLYAYDIDTGNTYYLMGISNQMEGLYATPNAAYCSFYTDNGISLYQLTIENGSASLREIAAFEIEYNDYEDEEGEDDFYYYHPDEVEPREFEDDTVIIADSAGDVLGGYSGGQWITNLGAGEYCYHSVAFNSISLTGVTGTVTSSGVDYNYSWNLTTSTMDGLFDNNGVYVLKAPGLGDNPLGTEFLYTCGAERLPVMQPVTDTSAILPVLQGIIDEALGQDTLQAQILWAVSADIDADGQAETVASASNITDAVDDTEADYLYALTCIIESDGSVCVITEDYENQYTDTCEYVLNIIDVDGDGKYEIVTADELWNEWHVTVYKYDGSALTEALEITAV